MNKQLLSLATAASLLLSVPTFAQLTSSPLEPGLYDFMKKSAPVTLVSDREMRLGATRVEYVSPEQVTISAVIAKVGTSNDRIERFISNYNDHASIGTMAYDAKSGSVVMYHNVNPKQVKLAEMSQVVTMFNDAAGSQSARLAAIASR